VTVRPDDIALAAAITTRHGRGESLTAIAADLGLPHWRVLTVFRRYNGSALTGAHPALRGGPAARDAYLVRKGLVS
jgi:hypothetical protein